MSKRHSYLGQGRQTLLLHVPDQLILRELQTLADVELGHVDPREEHTLADGGVLRRRKRVLRILLTLTLRRATLRTDGCLALSRAAG